MNHPLIAYPHLAARVFNTPLLMHPQKLDAIIAGLGQRLLGTQVLSDAQLAQELAPELFTSRRGPRAERGYQVIDGVALLNVNGALAHKTRMEGMSDTVLGYNGIHADLMDAMDNPDVHAVLQVWDSPGGEAQGAFQYADMARSLRGKKPFIAIADGMALSAGYLGASAADSLAVTQTGYAGSIGVVMRHVDLSAALMADGVRVSHIFAGAKKVDGNSYEPLTASARADFQAEVDDLYAAFIASVAASRPMTSAEALRATEAATYQGQHALKAGLADRIATVDELLTELAATRSRTYPVGQTARNHANATQRSTHMQGNTPDGQPSVTPEAAAPAAAAPAAAPALTQADIDTAVQAAVTSERARIAGIQAHANASAQPGLVKMAIDTGMSLEQASAMLDNVAPVVAAAAPSTFAAAMASVPNPKVSGIEPAAPSAQGDAAALAEQVLQTMRAFA